MKNETNKTKKEVKSKDKYNSKQTLAVMQSNNEVEVPERVLYLFSDGTFRFQFPDWTRSMAEGFAWSISQVRFKNIEGSMLQLQYKPRRNGSRSVCENVKGNRTGRNGKITKRPSSNSKIVRALSKPHSEIRGNPNGLK